jgi:transcriptional antiterminator NusG
MVIGTEEFDYLDEGNRQEEAVIDSLPKIQVKVKPVEQLKEEEKKEEKKIDTDSLIYIVKVTTNKEDKSLELIADKVNKKNINIYSVAKPHGLRGYIILESPDKENAEEAVFNLPYVKGIIPKQISYEEIKKMVEPRASDVKIEKNDIVEIISESFKNEKAKVLRVDKTKGEAVVSLLGAIVPIPVTVKLDNLRVIRREEEEAKNS